MTVQKKEQPAPQASPRPVAGQALTTTATGQSLAVSGETAGAAMASYMRAMVEARFVVAMNRPRDMMDVRAKLLAAIERPGFAGSMAKDDPANKFAAWYRRPRSGDGADEGFSIRFAEEAMLALGNVDVRTDVVFEDLFKRIVVVTVLDLETNVGQPSSIVVEKTVERKFLKKGQTALRSRLNSSGETVHVVEATEDEIFAKQNSYTSRIKRNEILRLVPGDLKAECRHRILAIRLGAAAQDPQKLQRTVADGFARLNVQPSSLKKYLGHDLASCTPAELADLRDLYKDIESGDTTWHDVMTEKFGEHEEDSPQKPPATDAMKDRLRQAAPPKPPKEQPNETATSTATEPGAATAAEKCTDATPTVIDGQPETDCDHMELGAVPQGTVRVCPTCTLEVRGPGGEKQRKATQSKLIT